MPGSRRRVERSTVFEINSTQYYVKMLDNTQSIICAFSLSCYEFIAKTSSNYSSVKNCEFLVRKVQLGWRPTNLTSQKGMIILRLQSVLRSNLRWLARTSAENRHLHSVRFLWRTSLMFARNKCKRERGVKRGRRRARLFKKVFVLFLKE